MLDTLQALAHDLSLQVTPLVPLGPSPSVTAAPLLPLFTFFGVILGAATVKSALDGLRSRIPGGPYATTAAAGAVYLLVRAHSVISVAYVVQIGAFLITYQSFPWHLSPFRWARRSGVGWWVILLAAFGLILIQTTALPPRALGLVGSVVALWLLLGDLHAPGSRSARVASAAGPAAGEGVIGVAVPSDVYLGRRLVYETSPEPAFDPLRNSRFPRELLLAALAGLVLLVAGTILLALEGSVLGVTRVQVVVAAYAWWGMAYYAFLLRPIPVLHSEWKLLLEKRGDAARSAFEHIQWALERRGGEVGGAILRLGLPAGDTRDYLELRDAAGGDFRGFVSCFAHGDDLFIGWTFWLYISPMRFAGLTLQRVLQAIRLRASELYLTLGYERVAALREALHAATREGIDAAGQRVRPRRPDPGGELPLTLFPPAAPLVSSPGATGTVA